MQKTEAETEEEPPKGQLRDPTEIFPMWPLGKAMLMQTIINLQKQLGADPERNAYEKQS